MNPNLKAINGIKTNKSFEWVGNYKNIAWVIEGLLDANGVCYTLIDDTGKLDCMFDNLDDACIEMKKVIDGKA